MLRMIAFCLVLGTCVGPAVAFAQQPSDDRLQARVAEAWVKKQFPLTVDVVSAKLYDKPVKDNPGLAHRLASVGAGPRVHVLLRAAVNGKSHWRIGSYARSLSRCCGPWRFLRPFRLIREKRSSSSRTFPGRGSPFSAGANSGPTKGSMDPSARICPWDGCLTPRPRNQVPAESFSATQVVPMHTTSWVSAKRNALRG